MIGIVNSVFGVARVDSPNVLESATMKAILREIVPPVVWRGVSKLRRKPREQSTKLKFDYGVEQPAEFYDQTYKNNDHWNDHYSQSRYYAHWSVILDRVRREGLKSILDLGCGPGQFACLVRDRGSLSYLGLDFSPARVARARAICPEYSFVAADVFTDRSLETHAYDCLVAMEFLEHIERDLEVLQRVQTGATVFATVPNFPSSGHVRHFANVREVEARYAQVLGDLDITPIVVNEAGRTSFLLQGVR